MDITQEIGLVVSEADHDSQLDAARKWRSRVSHKNQHIETGTDAPDFKVGRGFQRKFPTLGDTKQLRVPWVLHSHVDHMMIEMERVAAIRGLEYVQSICDKIIEGLEAVDL